MARDLNTTIIIGNVVADSDLTYTQGGTAHCKFSIANNRDYRTHGGEEKKKVNFFDVEIWGAYAEAMAPYLKKGKKVSVCGELCQQRWEDQNGNKRSRVYIKDAELQLLSTKDSSDAPGYSDDDIPM